MVRIKRCELEGEQLAEFEDVRRTVLKACLSGEQPLHAARAAMAIVKMMRRADTPYGQGFSFGLSEVEAIESARAAQYLQKIPIGERFQVYDTLGSEPPLQSVIDCYTRYGVEVDGFWVIAVDGALRLSGPSDGQAVWCALTKPEGGVRDSVGGGYCYLGLITEESAAMVKTLLGPSPTFEQLLMLPKWVFVDGWSDALTAERGDVYHVSVEAGFSMRQVFVGLAHLRMWPSGTMGAMCQSMAVDSEELVGTGPTLEDQVAGGAPVVAGYLLLGVTTAAYLSVKGKDVFDGLCVAGAGEVNLLAPSVFLPGRGDNLASVRWFAHRRVGPDLYVNMGLASPGVDHGVATSFDIPVPKGVPLFWLEGDARSLVSKSGCSDTGFVRVPTDPGLVGLYVYALANAPFADTASHGIKLAGLEQVGGGWPALRTFAAASVGLVVWSVMSGG
jgi:hypothetical protein